MTALRTDLQRDTKEYKDLLNRYEIKNESNADYIEYYSDEKYCLVFMFDKDNKRVEYGYKKGKLHRDDNKPTIIN